MCIVCDNQTSGGDMSPRMVICNDTNKPTTRFLGTKNIILYGMNKYGLSLDRAYQEAWNLLQYNRAEARKDNKIYFCEDHFDNDLRKYFDTVYGDKPQVHKSLIIKPTPKKEEPIKDNNIIILIILGLIFLSIGLSGLILLTT